MFERCVSLVGEAAYHNRQPVQLQQVLKKVRAHDLSLSPCAAAAAVFCGSVCAELTLSLSRTQSNFSATQQEIIVKFWTLNKDKVHTSLSSRHSLSSFLASCTLKHATPTCTHSPM
jgi:hypothetical protein